MNKVKGTSLHFANGYITDMISNPLLVSISLQNPTFANIKLDNNFPRNASNQLWNLKWWNKGKLKPKTISSVNYSEKE